MATRGVVYVHSAPPALCPHVEWAVGGVLDLRVTLDWTPQPAAPGVGARRAVLAGRRPAPAPGWPPRCATGRSCASRSPRSPAPAPRASAGPAPRRSGSSTPPPASTATSWSARTGCGPRWPGPLADPATDVVGEMHGLLGKAWDDELETFRYAGDGAPVRWLHQVV